MNSEGKFRAFYMYFLDVPEYYFLRLIDNLFDLPYRQIKLLCKWLIAYAIQHSPFDNCPVTLREYPFID